LNTVGNNNIHIQKKGIVIFKFKKSTILDPSPLSPGIKI